LAGHVMSYSPVSFTLADLARVTGGRLVGADIAFETLATDSRHMTADTAGVLFVALRGLQFDGHDFAAAAVSRGAVGILVERQLPLPIPQVVVQDVLSALAQFAHVWRRQFILPVIGVTGSNGKTTTKEMIGSILRRRGACLLTQGNLNNHIGVPLTL